MSQELQSPAAAPELVARMTFYDVAFSIRGCISRSTFWLGLFCVFVAYLVVAIPLAIILPRTHLQVIGMFCLAFCVLMLAWVSLAIQVKRWHDLGITGWAVLINLVPVINILVILIVLGMMPSKRGADKYQSSVLIAPVEKKHLPVATLAVTAIVSVLISAALIGVGFLTADMELSHTALRVGRVLAWVALGLGAYGMIAGIIAWIRRPKGHWEIIALAVAVLYAASFVLFLTYFV